MTEERSEQLKALVEAALKRPPDERTRSISGANLRSSPART